MRCVGVLALGLVSGLVCPAAAQVMQGPAGASRGVFGSSGGTSAPSLSLTVDFDGGYDAVDVPESEDGADRFQPLQSGWGGTTATSLRFQSGRPDQFMLVQGAGSFSRQQISSGVQAVDILQGNTSAQGAFRLGRRGGATMLGGVAYEPTYVFGAFDSLSGNADPSASALEATPSATGDPAVTLTSQRWLTKRAGGGAYYNWTARQRMTLGYEGLWIAPVSGPGFRSSAHATTLNHVWRPRSTTDFELALRHERTPQVSEQGLEQRLGTVTAESRVRYTRRLSPSRTLSFMGGVGAVRIDASASPNRAAFVATSPALSGTARLDVRAWALSFSARHDITVLNGLSPEPFRSTAATASIDGMAWRRLLLSLTGGYVRGLTLQGRDGSFDQRLVNALMRLALGTHTGIVVQYGYNDHAFRDVPVASPTLPLEFGRNSIRVGLTIWLPVYGSF